MSLNYEKLVRHFNGDFAGIAENVLSRIDARSEFLKELFMIEHGYKKLTSKRSEEFKLVVDADELIQEYWELYKEL